MESDPFAMSLQPGEAYLILGDGAGWAMNVSLATSDASFEGEDAGDGAGTSVAGVGDVDGDGYDDFLVGAPHNSEADAWAGQAYLILGADSGWSLDTSLAAADASFQGEAAGDQAGYGLAGIGDLDGDAYDDFLVGAPFNDEAAGGAGQTYLFRGAATGWAMDTPLTSAERSVLGESADDNAGRRLAGAGDVDGDGFDDLLIGAPRNSQAAAEAGHAYLVRGIPTCIDVDGDGYGSPGLYTCPGGDSEDCDDLDPVVYPGAFEACDGVDNDCNGQTDEDDPDCDGDDDDDDPADDDATPADDDTNDVGLSSGCECSAFAGSTPAPVLGLLLSLVLLRGLARRRG